MSCSTRSQICARVIPGLAATRARGPRVYRRKAPAAAPGAGSIAAGQPGRYRRKCLTCCGAAALVLAEQEVAAREGASRGRVELLQRAHAREDERGPHLPYPGHRERGPGAAGDPRIRA